MPMDTTLLAGTPAMFFPLNSTWPLRGLSSPATVFSVVDLPAPFAPISVTISPSLTSKEMPLMA